MPIRRLFGGLGRRISQLSRNARFIRLSRIRFTYIAMGNFSGDSGRFPKADRREPNEMFTAQPFPGFSVVSALKLSLPSRDLLSIVRAPGRPPFVRKVEGGGSGSGNNSFCRVFAVFPFSSRTRYQYPPFGLDTQPFLALSDSDFVPEGLEILARRELTADVLGYVEFHCQLESVTPSRSVPHQVLQVPCSPVDGGLDSVPHQVPKEVQGIEQRALAAGVRSYEERGTGRVEWST